MSKHKILTLDGWVLTLALFLVFVSCRDAYAQTAALGEFLSGLVPVAVILAVTAIPAAIAIPATILHTLFWRRDNRDDGGEPFTKKEIRQKTYRMGRVYGVGAVILLQGLVELLLGVLNAEIMLTWYIRGGLVALAFFTTGFASRLTYDILRGRAATKAAAGDDWWRRVYNYLTVKHVKAPDGSDDTFLVPPADEDKTIPLG